MKKWFNHGIKGLAYWIVLFVTIGMLSLHYAEAASKPEGPIDLEADKGTFDLKAKAHHFQGHIRLTQADFSVQSDQAWVRGEPGHQVVRATGSPVKVVWSSEHIQATALQAEYDQATGNLDLIGHVRLEQNGNFLEGEHIRYSLVTRAAVADGGKSSANNAPGRVKMRWAPENTKGSGKVSFPTPSLSEPSSAKQGGL